MLTAKARDFRPVLISLLAWGNKHLAPEGPSLVVVDKADGRWAEPVLVDRETGEGARQRRTSPWRRDRTATDRMRAALSLQQRGLRLPLVENTVIEHRSDEARRQ